MSGNARRGILSPSDPRIYNPDLDNPPVIEQEQPTTPPLPQKGFLGGDLPLLNRAYNPNAQAVPDATYVPPIPAYGGAPRTNLPNTPTSAAMTHGMLRGLGRAGSAATLNLIPQMNEAANEQTTGNRWGDAVSDIAGTSVGMLPLAVAGGEAAAAKGAGLIGQYLASQAPWLLGMAAPVARGEMSPSDAALQAGAGLLAGAAAPVVHGALSSIVPEGAAQTALRAGIGAGAGAGMAAAGGVPITSPEGLSQVAASAIGEALPAGEKPEPKAEPTTTPKPTPNEQPIIAEGAQHAVGQEVHTPFGDGTVSGTVQGKSGATHSINLNDGKTLITTDEQLAEWQKPQPKPQMVKKLTDVGNEPKTVTPPSNQAVSAEQLHEGEGSSANTLSEAMPEVRGGANVEQPKEPENASLKGQQQANNIPEYTGNDSGGASPEPSGGGIAPQRGQVPVNNERDAENPQPPQTEEGANRTTVESRLPEGQTNAPTHETTPTPQGNPVLDENTVVAAKRKADKEYHDAASRYDNISSIPERLLKEYDTKVAAYPEERDALTETYRPKIEKAWQDALDARATRDEELAPLKDAQDKADADYEAFLNQPKTLEQQIEESKARLSKDMGELTSGVNPETVKETAKLTGLQAKKAANAAGIKMLKVVRSLSDGSILGKRTQEIFIKNLGLNSRELRQMEVLANDVYAYFDKLPEEQGWKIIDDYENGRPLEGVPPPMVAAMNKMFSMMQDSWTQIQKIKGIDAYIEHYFPHIWEDNGKAAAFFSKRPFEGTKSYLNKRKIPTIAEGRASGLTPISSNPMELWMMRMMDMQKFITAHHIWEQAKDEGLIQYSHVPSAPDGYVKIDDRIGTVMGTIENEPVIRGYWMADPHVARVFNNYLSPGFINKVDIPGHPLLSKTLTPIVKTYRKYAMLQIAVNLGWSAFHIGVTSAMAPWNDFALGMRHLASGNTAEGLKSIGKSVLSATEVAGGIAMTGGLGLGLLAVTPSNISEYWRGIKGLKSYGLEDADLNAGEVNFNNALAESGFKPGKQLTLYNYDAPTRLLRNVRHLFASNVAPRERMDAGTKALGNAVLTTMTGTTKLIMTKWVEPLKYGALSQMIDLNTNEFEQGNISHEEFTRRNQAAAKSVDNRLGMLNYDNLFWNRFFVHAGQLSMLSLGWNFGDVRELGGGAKDIFAEGAKRLQGDKNAYLTDRAAALIALPIVMGGAAALGQYFMTGEPPKDALDLVAPRDGGKDKDGNPTRIYLKNYTVDMWEAAHHPISTVTNKLTPVLKGLFEIANNEDYWGNQIYNPHAKAGDIIGQLFHFFKNEWTPLTATNFLHKEQEGGDFGKASKSFYGVVPASHDIQDTPAQALAREISQRKRPQGGYTVEEQKAYENKNAVRDALRSGEYIPKPDDMTTTEYNALRKQAHSDYTPLQIKVKSMMSSIYPTAEGAKDALSVYAVANDHEKDLLTDIVKKGLKNLHKKGVTLQKPEGMSDEDWARVQ